MVSQTVKYALQILGYLSEHPGEWIQGEQIASATGIPSNYLSKILSQLRKRGLVKSQKGWGGGFLFEDRTNGRPIAEVVALFDGTDGERECIFGMPRCDPKHPCPLHPHWEPIALSYEKMLAQTTVGTLRGAKRKRVKS